MQDEYWGIWFTGTDDEPDTGWCKHDGQWLLFDAKRVADLRLAELAYLKGCAEVRPFDDARIARAAREYVKAHRADEAEYNDGERKDELAREARRTLSWLVAAVEGK
jgi:hypothetical protein